MQNFVVTSRSKEDLCFLLYWSVMSEIWIPLADIIFGLLPRLLATSCVFGRYIRSHFTILIFYIFLSLVPLILSKQPLCLIHNNNYVCTILHMLLLYRIVRYSPLLYTKTIAIVLVVSKGRKMHISSYYSISKFTSWKS